MKVSTNSEIDRQTYYRDYFINMISMHSISQINPSVIIFTSTLQLHYHFWSELWPLKPLGFHIYIYLYSHNNFTNQLSLRIVGTYTSEVHKPLSRCASTVQWADAIVSTLRYAASKPLMVMWNYATHVIPIFIFCGVLVVHL